MTTVETIRPETVITIETGEEHNIPPMNIFPDAPHSATIPTPLKLGVWERMNGQRPGIAENIQYITQKAIESQEKIDKVDRNLTRLQEMNTVDSEEAYKLYDEARHQLTHFSSEYKSFSETEKKQQATLLIDTLRTAPEKTGKTYLQTTLYLLTLENVGATAAEVILDDVSRRAYQFNDLSTSRRMRAREKAEETLQSLEGNVRDEYAKNILPYVTVNTTQGITDMLAEEDRLTYQAIMKRISPAEIARMVGNITSEELLKDIKYDAVAKAAERLCPVMGNPFRIFAENKAVIFEYFAHTPRPVGKPVKM